MWTIGKEPVTIGRSKENTIVVSDRFASLFHCKMSEQDDGLVILTDLASTNGTYVNRRKVDAISLKDGDRVMIGHTCFWLSDMNTDLIVHGKDKLKVWLVRKRRMIQTLLAFSPIAIMVEERYLKGFERLKAILESLLEWL